MGVGAQDCDHVGGGCHRQLLQLRLAQLVQLQLDVQAHLDGVGGGGQRQGRRHHSPPQKEFNTIILKVKLKCLAYFFLCRLPCLSTLLLYLLPMLVVPLL